MSPTDPRAQHAFFTTDSSAWWQARRPRYNIALGLAGWVAYGLNVALFYAFHQPIWRDWRGGLSMTLGLGIGFLFVMGMANIFYLLGPAVESVVKPSDTAKFRRTAHAMGFWGSVALPFFLPLISLAMLIGGR